MTTTDTAVQFGVLLADASQKLEDYLSKVKIKKSQLSYKSFPDYSLNKYALLALVTQEEGIEDLNEVCIPVQKTQKVIQPSKITDLISNPKSDSYIKDAAPLEARFVNSYKGLYFTLGKVEEGTILPYASGQKDEFSYEVYKGSLYKYDYRREGNQFDYFWEIRIDFTSDLDPVVLYIDQGIEGHSRYITDDQINLFISRLLRDVLHVDSYSQYVCRSFTSNATNNYQGYSRVADIQGNKPNTVDKINKIHDTLNLYRSKIGVNSFAVLVGSLVFLRSSVKDTSIDGPLYKIKEKISEFFWELTGPVVGLK